MSLDRHVEKCRLTLASGGWWTLAELAKVIGCSEAAASARLRDLRKVEFGSHRVERRHIGPKGRHAYRLVTNRRRLARGLAEMTIHPSGASAIHKLTGKEMAMTVKHPIDEITTPAALLMRDKYLLQGFRPDELYFTRDLDGSEHVNAHKDGFFAFARRTLPPLVALEVLRWEGFPMSIEDECELVFGGEGHG